jgi:hypothetical protein
MVLNGLIQMGLMLKMMAEKTQKEVSNDNARNSRRHGNDSSSGDNDDCKNLKYGMD